MNDEGLLLGPKTVFVQGHVSRRNGKDAYIKAHYRRPPRRKIKHLI